MKVLNGFLWHKDRWPWKTYVVI